MARPYGKTPKNTTRRKSRSKPDASGLKVKLRGRDGAPLSMAELQQALYELARKLKPHGDLRAKWATVYLTLVDENGEEAAIDAKGEWTIYPYKSAADEHGA